MQALLRLAFFECICRTDRAIDLAYRLDIADTLWEHHPFDLEV